MAKGLAIFLVALSWLASNAQPNSWVHFEVSGRITDTTGDALGQATVQLAAGADTLMKLSRSNGNFDFSRVPNRKFRLLVTMQGYLPFSAEFSIPDDRSTVELKTIVLHTDFNELDPVLVSRVRPFTIQQDTITYIATAFSVRDGSEVGEILKRLPGIEVDINGNVVIQGKPISKVLVNGKEFFGSDVLLAIQNLPADIVEKLQVIDDYGDKARLTGVKTGVPDKVLNIVLKTDNRNGRFAQIHGASGNQDKYEGGALANSFRGERQLSTTANLSNNNPNGRDFATQAGLSYADQWDSRWGGAVNLNRSTQDPQTTGYSISRTYYPGEFLQQISANQNSNSSANNGFEGRLTFKPNNNSTFRLTLSGNTESSDSRGSNNFTFLQQDSGFSKTTTGQSSNDIKLLNETANCNLYFERISPLTRRRFNLEGSVIYTGGNQTGNQQSAASVLSDSAPTNTFYHYLNTNTNHNLNLNFNTIYFIPLNSRSFFEMGYHIQSSTSNSNSLTRQPDSGSGALIPIDSLSAEMRLSNLTQNLHVGFTGSGDRFSFSAIAALAPGLQGGTVNGKNDVVGYHYISILPNLNLTWNITKARRLGFEYNGRTTLPSIQELSPVTNISNPQYPVTGNPELRPAYTNNISLRYEESNLRPTQYFGFGAAINASATNRTIIQEIITPKDSSQVVQSETWLNRGNSRALGGDYHLTLPAIFKKWLRINYAGSVTGQQSIVIVNSVQSLVQSWIWSQSLHLQILIPERIETDLSGTYNQTQTTYSQSSHLPTVFRSASVTWSAQYYFFRHWILNYRLNQTYLGNNNQLFTAPATLTASIQRQFLPHNMATVTFTGYNLFNASGAAAQSTSGNTETQSRPMLNSRYFLLGIYIKLRRFK